MFILILYVHSSLRLARFGIYLHLGGPSSFFGLLNNLIATPEMTTPPSSSAGGGECH